MPMATKRLRERLALFGGTALLALAILGAIARRTLSRRPNPTGHDEPLGTEPPPGTAP